MAYLIGLLYAGIVRRVNWRREPQVVDWWSRKGHSKPLCYVIGESGSFESAV